MITRVTTSMKIDKPVTVEIIHDSLSRTYTLQTGVTAYTSEELTAIADHICHAINVIEGPRAA